MGLFWSKKQDQHFEVFNASPLLIICNYRFGSLVGENLEELVKGIDSIIPLSRLEIQRKVCPGNALEEFLKRKPSLDKPFSFFDKNNVEISIFRPFHYLAPPDEIFLEFNEGNLSQFEGLLNYLVRYKSFFSLYIINRKYRSLQNETQESAYKSYGLNTGELHFKKSITGGKEIDVSKNPGYSDVIAHTWIMAAWKMYFGPDFYTYASKEQLLSFKEGIKVSELENDRVFIQLYENHNEAHFEKSKIAQFAFQKHIKMHDLVAKDRPKIKS